MKTKDLLVGVAAFAAVMVAWHWWKKRQANAANPDPTSPAAAVADYWPGQP